MSKKASKPKSEPSGNPPIVDGVTIHCVYDELRPVDVCQANPANPNKHSDYQIGRLAALIKYHGWRRPVVMSRRSGMVVSGHARVAAAKTLKMTTVPVDWQDYDSPQQELADMLADNVIDDLSELDGLAVADILVELDQKDYPLELTGLREDQIEQFITGPIDSPQPTTPIVGDLPAWQAYMIVTFATPAEEVAAANQLGRQDFRSSRTITWQEMIAKIRS